MEVTTATNVGSGDLVELYRQWRLPLTRLAYLLVDDLAEAEDVVHDAFLALHARGGRLHREGAEGA
ncbi:MAG: hypothetical protein U0Q15_08320 [Kineosporiaceae bacterium]